MDTNQAQRMANLYDACWELVREGTREAGISVPTRVRFVSLWGEPAVDQPDDTLMAYARNLLRHNARPNV